MMRIFNLRGLRPAGRSPGWQSIATVGFLLAIVAAAFAVLLYSWERLHTTVEPKAETLLATCLGNNMVPELSVTGEALIEQACEARVRNRNSAAATCVLQKRASLTSDDGADAVQRECGLQSELE